MTPLVAVLPGDGIGPEIVAQAVRVLRKVADVRVEEALIGGAAYDATGHPLPPATLALCRRADAVLLGAVGGPKWDAVQPATLRPEIGALLPLRKELGLFANLRPARLFAPLADACPLRKGTAIDLLIVRELTGGIYFGRKERTAEAATDTCTYTVDEVVRIARVAFEAARKRAAARVTLRQAQGDDSGLPISDFQLPTSDRPRVCSVDKANVLETSRLWREVVTRVGSEYPDVELTHMLVDNCAMQLVRNPGQFDVIVTDNMFGDIVSDEAAMLTGSLGMLPSASVGAGTFGLYEPIHGSAPDIAGKGVANPLATILSVAMMLRHSLGMPNAASAVERAVERTLAAGYRTADIAPRHATQGPGLGSPVIAGSTASEDPGLSVSQPTVALRQAQGDESGLPICDFQFPISKTTVGTTAMGDRVLQALEEGH